MTRKQIIISGSLVEYYFDAGFAMLQKLTNKANTILVTDENVFALHPKKFQGWKTVVLKPGEENKQQSNVDELLMSLIKLEADRNTTLVGVGGGVVTDITGYAASVYLRGINFGFVPTTLLAMVDASIGGKNGVDVGIYKNLVGIIRQPSFLLFDTTLLSTLPEVKWQNGFAEIIKHAVIKDAVMFKRLEKNELAFFQNNKRALNDLVMRNALLKTEIVKKDPLEKANRKLLNFGHTIGHAIETENGLMHGQTVAIGMVYAAHLSRVLTGYTESIKLINLIEKYGLPSHTLFDLDKAIQNMKMDKKRIGKSVQYVLLEETGKAVVVSIPLKRLEKLLKA